MRFLATSTFCSVSLLLSALLTMALLLFVIRELLISYLEEDNA
jgi:hypothetical protein